MRDSPRLSGVSDSGRLERRYQLAIRFQLAYGYKAYLLLAHHH